MSILDILQYLAFSAIFVGFIVLILVVCAIFLVIDTKEDAKISDEY